MLKNSLCFRLKQRLKPNLTCGIRSCSYKQAEGPNSSDIDQHDDAGRKRKLYVHQLNIGRKCIFIPGVFRKNCYRLITMLQDSYGTSVERAIYFDKYTGFGDKECFLVQMKDKIPWRDRLMKFDLDQLPPGNHRNHVLDVTKVIRHRDLSPEVLNNCENFAEQIHCVSSNARLPPDVTMCHDTVISVLTDCLRSQAPHIFNKGQLVPFGSGPCGLALQGSSDLDLVYLDDLKPRQKSESQRLLREAGPILKKLKSISRVQYILRATVPILKFTEFRTGLNIDISAFKSDGIEFSTFFKWLSRYDSRIFPLIVTLRFWSKVNKLECIAMSNFVLTMLVIHFLQYQKIVPPFKKILDDDKRIVDKSVLQGHSRYKSANSSNLDYLLTEFFNYYSTFDFKESTIDLYDGKVDLRSGTNIAFQEHLVMRNPLLQDSEYPTTWNIGRNVTPEILERFQSLCKQSLELISEHKQKTSRKEWGLNCVLPCNR